MPAKVIFEIGCFLEFCAESIKGLGGIFPSFSFVCVYIMFQHNSYTFLKVVFTLSAFLEKVEGEETFIGKFR